MKENRKPTNLTLLPSLWAKAQKQAKNLNLSGSSYIESLIQKDLQDDISNREVVSNLKQYIGKKVLAKE